MIKKSLWVLQAASSIARMLATAGFQIDMCSTCNYAEHMSKMIQIRNVPDALHRKLKARAAMAGMSLSDYLLSEIRKTAEIPTLEEFHALLSRRKPVRGDLDIVRILHEERESR